MMDYDLSLFSAHSNALTARAQVVAGTLRASSRRRVVLSCRTLESFVPGLLGAWEAGFAVELHHPEPIGEDEAVTVLHDLPGQPGVFLPSLLGLPQVAGADVAHDGRLRMVRGDERLLTWPENAGHRTAAQLLGEVESLAETFAPLPRAFLSTLSMCDPHGLVVGVLLPLRLGKTPALLASRDLAESLQAQLQAQLQAHDAGVLVSSPEHLQSFVEAKLPRGIFVISGGARLPAELQLELVFRHGWTVHDILGTTETGAIATRTSPLSPWKHLPGVSLEGEPLADAVPEPAHGGDGGNVDFAFEPIETPHAFRLVVPKDCVFFRGHFVELALLPAVVQLSRIALPLARRSWPDLGTLSALRRAKFRRPIFPGQELIIRLSRADRKVGFEILIGDATAASGTFDFGGS